MYIDRLQNKFSQYISTHPIMEYFVAAELKLGLHLSRQWWEQPDLDILGIRVGHAASEGGGGERE